MAGKSAYLIAGGILVTGGVIGLAYWYYTKGRVPRAYLAQVQPPRRSGNTITIAATVQNIGRSKGYFKIQALLVKPECPYQGTTGLTSQGGGSNWMNIVNWINSRIQQGDWSAGAWIGYPEGQGWAEIPARSQATLSASANVAPEVKGNYNLYIMAAVSKDGTTQGRIKDQEYYYWVPGIQV